MTEPLPDDDMPDLLESSDFQRFKSKDESWFLGAAGETIRGYCGWHIYPVLTDDVHVGRIGGSGIVMLPTLNLVSVQSVSIGNVELPPESYSVHSAGYIHLGGHTPTGVGGFVAPGPVLDPLRGIHNRYATVVFTHGLAKMPKVVAEVGFELTARTLEKPAGVAKSLDSGPYRFQFNEFGAVLSDDQRHRLDPYCIVEV